MAAREQASVALAVAAVVVGVVVVVGGVGATDAGTNHGTRGDYTVFLPNEIDHYPGDRNPGNASIQHLAALEGTFDGSPSPKGYEAAGFLIIGNEDIDFSSCSTEDTSAFGLDRENDADGTTTDESLLAARENSEFDEHEIVIDFFDEGDLAGSPISINDVDEVVAVQNECYTMPSEPGWYQINGFLNGTGYGGNQFAVTLDSHYFYICECGSEQEAREKLGPPPSEQGGSDPTPTATATPESTATATPEPTATEAPEVTATAEPAATATATATDAPATRTAEPAATATATDTPESVPEATGTATPVDDGGGRAGDGNGGAESDRGGAVSTATPVAGGGSGVGSIPATPTIGAGPGFGAVAALVGLLAVALLAPRRD